VGRWGKARIVRRPITREFLNLEALFLGTLLIPDSCRNTALRLGGSVAASGGTVTRAAAFAEGRITR
jgi:hypothetical protein